MQDKDPAGRGPRRVEVAGLSPVRAFFVVGALAAIPLALVATRDEAPATSPSPAVRSPSYELTDAEAIAEFDRLKGLLVAAYQQRDLSLVDEIAAPDAAPGIDRIQKEIRTLLRDDVLYRTRERRESVDLITNDLGRIEVREVVVKFPRFLDEETGRNLATANRPERQTIIWVLQRYSIHWKIHSATIVSAEPTEGRSS